MKRIFALLLALIMALSLCACGGGKKMTKEEMLEQATEIDDYQTELAENPLRAEEKYIGNAFLIDGFVSHISSETVDVGDFTVTLPEEDIKRLSSGQKITIVGIIDTLEVVESETMMDGWSMPNTDCHGTISNGYFVNDTYDVSGTLVFYYKDLYDGVSGKLIRHNNGDPDYWLFGIDTEEDNVISVNYDLKEDVPVEHIAGQDIYTVTISGTNLKYKDKITVSAKVFRGDDYSTLSLRDVELVSVDN